MKKLVLAGACLLLVGLFPLTGCDTGARTSEYNYYIQISNQYFTAAAAEQDQANYFSSLAQGLVQSGMTSQEQYNSLIAMSDQHHQTAEQYIQLGTQYRDKAAALTKPSGPFGLW